MRSDRPLSFNQYRLFQLVANIILIAVWFLANQGLLFWDDFSYLNFAHQVNAGEFEVTSNHFTSRIALIYPVAWGIKFLGLSAHTAAVFPLVCYLLLLNLTLWVGSKVGQWTALIGGILVLCDYHMIYFGSHLFPELPLTLCIFVFLMSYYLLLRDDIVPRYAALLGALALFGAFLIKTTVFLVLPLILYLFINDRRQKRHGSYWLVFISLGLFFLIVNALWYEEVKGDFLYRFKNIANNHVATPKTFFDKGGVELLKRLTYLPLLGFLKGGYFIPLLAGLPAIVKLKRRDFKLQRADCFWPIAALFMLLTFWFISTNWRFYSPLPTENRHIVFFIPAFVMSAAIYWPKRGLFEWMWRNKLVAAGFILLLAVPAYAISKSNDTNFKDQSDLIRKHFVDNNGAQLVITDGLLSYGYQFYYGMEGAEDVYLWFSETETFEILNSFEDSAYLLINRANFNEDYEDSENYTSFISQMQDFEINIGMIQKLGEVELYLLTK